jgi:hypothetical protein
LAQYDAPAVSYSDSVNPGGRATIDAMANGRLMMPSLADALGSIGKNADTDAKASRLTEFGNRETRMDPETFANYSARPRRVATRRDGR